MSTFDPFAGRLSGVGQAVSTATVSVALIEDILLSMGRVYTPRERDVCVQAAGIAPEFLSLPGLRITQDQFVRLYQESAALSGDEMMGLWSRPIRKGALKYIVRAVKDAPNIKVALYRFSQMWNLLLDDYQVYLHSSPQGLTLELRARHRGAHFYRLAHVLFLKLGHGIVSWLMGREAPVSEVCFAYPAPDYMVDLPVLFPAPIRFSATYSCLVFPYALGALRPARAQEDVRPFLLRAPRDWLFTTYHEHALRLRVRELLYTDLGQTQDQVAHRLHVSARTLMRRLQQEQLSFQGIKDELRRDLAILGLLRPEMSLAQVSYSVGFSSPAVFHRAFRQWTGMTPGVFRRTQQGLA